MSPAAVIAAAVALALLGVAVLSRYALVTVLLDIRAAALVLAPPMLAGLWLVPLFRLGPLPLRWHFVAGAALGLGAISLLVLILGLAGVLERSVWIALVIVLAVAGLFRIRTFPGVVAWGAAAEPSLAPGLAEALSRQERRRRTQFLHKARPEPRSAVAGEPSGGKNSAGESGVGLAGAAAQTRNIPAPRRDRFTSLPWLLIAPSLCLSLLAASTAPGFLWREEGYGYDVLEYHLQIPKEYRHADRISYLPHNVYGSFPSNVEMLYLLGMVLLDDDIDAGTTANMIHLALGVLAVIAVWVAAREWSAAAGIVAAVATATTGWLTYLSGLAYVEHGVLFFGMLAAAAMFKHWGPAGFSGAESPVRTRGGGDREVAARQPGTGWLVFSGVAAGFACGCKYPAGPMIAAPLALAAVLAPGRAMRARVAGLFIFVASTTLATAPWLLKNLVYTGNPVFPLGSSVFTGLPDGWSADARERWEAGHRPVVDGPAGGRWGELWRHVIADPYQRFGPAILLLALAGLARRRRDATDYALLAWLALQLAVWLFATHLYARFAAVFLLPLALLAGRCVSREGGKRRAVMIAAALALGAGWNFTYAARLFREEHPGDAPASLIYDGLLPGYEYFRAVNQELPAESKLLLVGDARAFYIRRPVDYCVVFNHSPLTDLVRSGAAAGDVVAWLRSRGYSHVLANWAEIDRLRGTYGFPVEIDTSLFDRLEAAGLVRAQEFPHPRGSGRYVTLYRVPSE
ncbi:MAG: hypothetical protein HY763_12475 [Planctomycetes bacterium]|nr:hypothetical protein [Planctomycetota bacterium]